MPRRNRLTISNFGLGMIRDAALEQDGAYSLYTLSQETIERHGTDRLKYTIPLVIMGVFRYLYLVHQRGGGGEPESILIGDRPLQAVLLVYAAIAGWALYL